MNALLLLGLIAQLPGPPAPTVSACEPGSTRACVCSTQRLETVPGLELCTDVGEWAACGCPEAWPYLGPTCGATRCPAVAPESGGYDGQPCCTESGACGLTSEEAFGSPPVCLEVGSRPAGVPDEASCDLRIPFVETSPCCRPDGRCGLWLDYANWRQVGCIERTELAALLGRNLLLQIFLAFNPFSLEDVEEARCTYPE